ncbi:MAG: exodeoxyribonuclease V subunit alpha [Lysobacterales bacterium]
MNAESTLAAALALPEAECFVALERHLARWTHARSKDPLVALAVLAAAAAEAQGDACAELTELGGGTPLFPKGPMWPDWGDWRAQLANSSWVGTSAANEGRALVLEADGACYLARVWRQEHALALAVRARCAVAPKAAAANDDVPTFFPALFARDDADQRDAALAGLDARLLLLTGPPGSGKTHTLLRILLARRGVAGRPLRIKLAAPTGKAAQRIAEALQQGKQQLRNACSDPQMLAWLDEIPDEASTLHRLLEYQPMKRKFARNAQSPLTADVIAIDEASMVDLAMMRQLFEATPQNALLVLAGDPDQLASVAAGSVLADLVRASDRMASCDSAVDSSDFSTPGLPRVARLTRSRRSNAALTPLFDAVRDGAAELALEFLRTQRAWHDAPTAAALTRALDAEIAPVAGAGRFDALLTASDPAIALAELTRWQCLCALRQGPFGSLAIAARIEGLLRERGARSARDGGFHGRAVIIEQNDYGKHLFNGDIGVTLLDAQGRAQVWFVGRAENERTTEVAGGAGVLRAFAPGDLPAHTSAFALTVHKSQGAEFDGVALVLPPQDARVLGRELVYTALTRARSRVDVYATEAVFAAALARPLARRGRLRERIRGEL